MTKAFEFCKRVRRILLIGMGESLAYGTKHTEGSKTKPWSPEFVVENLNDCRKAAMAENRSKLNLVSFNPNELTTREMQELGFSTWELEDSPYVVWMIPLYLALYIEIGVKLTNIFDKEMTFQRPGDNPSSLDHRCGMLAYGVKKLSGKKY